MSAPSIPQPKIEYFTERDKNGVVWMFPRQEFDFSCGPACLTYTKSLVHNTQVTEKGFREKKARKQVSQAELRRPVGLSDKNAALNEALAGSPSNPSPDFVIQQLKRVLAHKPEEALTNRSHGTWTGHSSWGGKATRPEYVLEALQTDPFGVKSARLVKNDYLEHLSKTTSQRPSILAVAWVVHYKGDHGPSVTEKETAKNATGGLGGHFILCVGSTKDSSQFIILDPMRGLKYIDRADVTDTCILYDNGVSIGKADPQIDKSEKPPTKIDSGLVDYLTAGGLSKCGMIVTY